MRKADFPVSEFFRLHENPVEPNGCAVAPLTTFQFRISCML